MSSGPIARILKADQVDVTSFQRHPAPAPAPAASFESELEAAYASGFQAGRAEVDESLLSQAEKLSTTLDRARSEITAAARAQRAADVEEILTTATDLASWLARRHLVAEPDDALDRVRAVLSEVAVDDPIEVEVAPSLVAPLEEWLDTQPVTVRANDALAPGEAVLTTPSAQIDATFDDALARVRAALTGTDLPTDETREDPS